MKIFKKIFDHEYKELERFKKIADEVIALDEEISKLSDKKLKDKTEEFKKRLENGETLEDIKVEAFAVAREAAYRVIGEKPYYVQILGGLAIHYGNIAEMRTGEGKTLTSTMPAYLKFRLFPQSHKPILPAIRWPNYPTLLQSYPTQNKFSNH